MNSIAGIARGRKIMAATAAAVVAAGWGVFGAPAAGAADYQAATGGALEWGFKQSFRSYITGKIANGSIEVGNGASYNGSTFSFPPVSGATTVSSGNQGTVALQGEVHFTGHEKNDVAILDTTLSDWKIRLDGQQAEIIVDVVAREFKGTDYNDVGEFITSDDVPLATVILANQPDFTSGTIDLSGTAVLSNAGARAFGGFYTAGETLDNTGGTLTLGGSATTQAGGRATTGIAQECGGGALGVISDGSEREGVQGIVQEVNDTFGLWNNLLVNTDRMFCNLDALQGRFKPEPSQGAATPAPTATGAVGTADQSGTAGAAGGVTTVAPDAPTTAGTPVTAGATGTTGTTGTAVQEASSGGSVCAADGALGVTAASAQWGIKQSFQNYIRGSIAKGQWSLSGVGYDNQQFLFAGSNGSVTPADKSGSISFPGTLQFAGHGGTLNLQMSAVEIRFAGNTGEVIADVTSSDMNGQSTAFGRTVLGTLNFNSLAVTDTAVSGDAAVTLTAAGSQAFADFYEPGQQLDPISIQASLGGAANCSDAQGTAASGAAISGVSSGGPDAAEALEAGVPPAFGDSSSGTGADAPGGDSQFRIRSVGEDAEGTGNFGLGTTTTALLIVAAFIVAGGSMTRFTTANPIG